ncbi:MAG TPA: hypothetical protein ENK13_01020, partial [Thermopetrobacter sp.]|nr:hypothetical protein [Thermopetrobacter sp.]
ESGADGESWLNEVNALLGGDAADAPSAAVAGANAGGAAEPEAVTDAADAGAGFAPEDAGQEEGPADAEAAPDEPWRDPQATLFASARAAGYPAAAEEGGAVQRSGPADAAALPDRAAIEARLHLDLTADGTGAAEPADRALAPGEGDSADDGAPPGEGDSADDGDAAGGDRAVMRGQPVTDDVADDVIETPAAPGATAAPEGSDEGFEEGLARRAESLTEKIKALEEAIGRSRERFEPDGPGEDDYAGTPVAPIAWEDAETAGPAAAQDPAPAAGVIRGVFEQVRDPAPAALHAKTAGGGAEAGHGNAAAAAEGAAARGASPAAAGMGGGAAEDSAAEDAAVPFEDETVLDEDSLRELVAEIVRQELQGALGERITRNVRKLVRREIHRALAALDLD